MMADDNASLFNPTGTQVLLRLAASNVTAEHDNFEFYSAFFAADLTCEMTT